LGKLFNTFIKSDIEQWTTCIKINIKKATGCDGIPAKIVKHSRSVFAAQLTDLINLSVDWCISRSTEADTSYSTL